MKKPLLVLALCLSVAIPCFAAERAALRGPEEIKQPTENVARDAALKDLSSLTLVPAVSLRTISSTASLAANSFSPPLAAAAPAPEPKFIYGSRDDYRFQLGFAYTYVRFRSSLIDASLNGINTSLVWYANEWFGVEGDVAAAFSSKMIFDREHVKFLTITGGPRIAWRQRKWEPFMHFLAGFVHLQPQTLGNDRTALAYTAGGGVDLRWRPQLSFRIQGDWVRTRLFSETQNNYQIAAGLVFHF
jgi:hypothetical protein